MNAGPCRGFIKIHRGPPFTKTVSDRSGSHSAAWHRQLPGGLIIFVANGG